MQNANAKRSNMSKARGLGSAQGGTRHWWHQRLTSVALTFLGLWFLYALAVHIPHTHEGVVNWMQNAWNMSLVLLTILAALYHGALGLQVIIEDYVHTEWVKMACIYTMKFTFVFMWVTTIVAAIRIQSL